MRYNDLFDFIYSESSFSVVPDKGNVITVNARFGETKASSTRKYQDKDDFRDDFFYVLMKCDCVAQIINTLIPKYEKHFEKCSI
jgi:hypothetical protein